MLRPGECQAGGTGGDRGSPSTKNTDVVAAGLSLLLGPDGRARQQRDADAIRKLGSVPLVVALLASAGEEVETLVTTVAVASQVLN